MTEVKICGITTPEAINAAAKAGARYIGFVFAPRSKRFVPAEQAALLARCVPTGVKIVGLFVNPDDETLAHILGRVSLDMIQLHGAEPPARVSTIKSRYGLPVMKAMPIAAPDDLSHISTYEQVSDWLLFDAKSSTESEGGNGVAFDWKILGNKKFARPWMLAGGLTPENVGAALDILRPDAVDVSSGVEASPAIKDAGKITAFISAVKSKG